MIIYNKVLLLCIIMSIIGKRYKRIITNYCVPSLCQMLHDQIYNQENI